MKSKSGGESGLPSTPKRTPESIALDADALRKVIAAQARISSSPLSLATALQIVVEAAMDATGASGAVVELAEGDDMVYSAVCGSASAQLGLRIRKAGSLSGQCVASGETLVCDDSETDGRVNVEACRRVGLRSMVVSPLKYESRTVGALKVLKPIPRGFGPGDVAMIGMLTDTIAATIAHSSQYETALDRGRSLLALATLDSLTGLSNRAAFLDRLRQSIAAGKRHGDEFGLALLDMDRLKPINDTYGHAAGDAALRAFAERLKDSCRASDFPARLGGDEFGVLLQRLSGNERLDELGASLAKAVSGPVDFKATRLDVAASVGVVKYPEDGDEPDSLLERADAAMYAMKRFRKAERID